MRFLQRTDCSRMDLERAHAIALCTQPWRNSERMDSLRKAGRGSKRSIARHRRASWSDRQGKVRVYSTRADIMTFSLAIERKHRVLRAKATGIIASQDLVDLDNSSGSHPVPE
jgi:hypothetical protein